MLLAVACGRTAGAQSLPAKPAPTEARWHAFAGGMVFGASTDDAAKRILGGDSTLTGGFVFEGGVRVVKNFAVGVEVFPRSSLSTTHSTSRTFDAMVESERIVAFVGHARVLEQGDASLEVVFGPSFTWADGSTSTSPFETPTTLVHRRTLGWTGGVDCPLRAAPRFAFVIRLRVLGNEHLYYVNPYAQAEKWGLQLMAGLGGRVLF